MAKKKRYHLSNWAHYNKALVDRGSLTVWFDEGSIAKWHDAPLTSERGRPRSYSDMAILCALTLRSMFHLRLRATQGFISSLTKLLQLPISTPNYTTLCRRQKTLLIPKYQRKQVGTPMHLVVDATGIKIYGEGEWKVRQHGKEKRRTWRKLHVSVDEATQDIVAGIVTESNVHDSEVLDLLLQADNLKVSQVTGDGAYDSHDCYEAAINVGAIPCFPPRANAIRNKPMDEAWRLRNHVVSRVKDNGLKKWKKKNNYHRRSLAENAFSRLKKIFGNSASSRTFENQAVELGLRCYILNRINQLGLPDSYRT